MTKTKKRLTDNKAFGVFLLLMGLAALGVIIVRVCCYRFEYDPVYYPVDHGRFNFFSYFTVQSNIYVCFYLICLALAVFGSERAKRISFHPMVRLTVTTYILVTGAVYCAGIPMGMTPPLYWDGFQHAMLGCVQVLHHMIMPVLMLALFFIPVPGSRVDMKKLPVVGIYPFVYSVISIARGGIFSSHFYTYPFYRPDFFWNIFLKGREIVLSAAYLLMLPMLLAGIGLFILIAFVLAIIYNRINADGAAVPG